MVSFGQTATDLNTSGNTKKNLKDYYGAIKDYSRAIRLNPDYTNAYFNRGIANYNLKDYKGAIEDYNIVIEFKPDFASAFNNRGLAKANLKDYKGAIEDYSRAIELNPDYADAYSNRGLAKNDLKDNKGAGSDYSRAIELNPDYADAYSWVVISGRVKSWRKFNYMKSVTVTNLRSKKVVLTDVFGSYSINAKINDTIEYRNGRWKPLKVKVSSDLNLMSVSNNSLVKFTLINIVLGRRWRYAQDKKKIRIKSINETLGGKEITY